MTNLSKLRKVVDDNVEKAEGVSCRNWCSNCCYYDVDILPQEGEEIIEFIRKNKVEVNIYNLKMRNRLKEPKHEHKRCALLDEKGSCQVYEVRPLTCRQHIVSSHPDNCSVESKESVTALRNDKIKTTINCLLWENKGMPLHKYLFKRGLQCQNTTT